VSFCSVGCSSLQAGLVDIVDPATGAVKGTLFRTSGFNTGGLAYDPSTDSLWVGDWEVIRNVTLTGAVIGSFGRPQPGGFVSGLELISTPEPGYLAPLGVCLLTFSLKARRTVCRRRAPKAPSGSISAK
jgi:hypothetical protein